MSDVSINDLSDTSQRIITALEASLMVLGAGNQDAHPLWVKSRNALFARIVELEAAAAPRPAEEADGRHQPTEEAIESALDFGRRQLAFAAKERERRQKQTRSSRRVNGHAI